MLQVDRFKERFVQTAALYKDARIVSGSEAYTSQQCGCCGRLNKELGSSERFACSACGLEMDRDVHAARNILLKFLSFDTPPSCGP